MEEILNKITQIIQEYEGGQFLTPDRLREMLRNLSAQVYYLTEHKIIFKNRHNEIQYRHKGSVSSGEILAHEQCPELYQTRYIIRAAENVMISMRMELSILKNDQ